MFSFHSHNKTCALGRIRTYDRRIRSPLLYPAELWALLLYFPGYSRIDVASGGCHGPESTPSVIKVPYQSLPSRAASCVFEPGRITDGKTQFYQVMEARKTVPPTSLSHGRKRVISRKRSGGKRHDEDQPADYLLRTEMENRPRRI